MGVRLASVATTTKAADPNSSVEIVVVTTGPLNLVIDGAQVLLQWYVAISAAASVTAMRVRLRRGPLVTSPLINISSSVAVAASTVVSNAGVYADQPGLGAELQYSMTLEMVGAAGTSTISDLCLLAMVL